MEKQKPSTLAKFQREKMMRELVKLLYSAANRDALEQVILSYGYSPATIPDLISEATHKAAKKFTQDEVEVAKNQIKQLSEEIMSDKDEFSMARIKAAELLGKLMKAFQPEIALQTNITNNLNFNELTTEQLKQILELKHDD